jgi:hypothetical protein
MEVRVYASFADIDDILDHHSLIFLFMIGSSWHQLYKIDWIYEQTNIYVSIII